jgi:hypothetical protein
VGAQTRRGTVEHDLYLDGSLEGRPTWFSLKKMDDDNLMSSIHEKRRRIGETF